LVSFSSSLKILFIFIFQFYPQFFWFHFV
jgi:hypothetical protein